MKKTITMLFLMVITSVNATEFIVQTTGDVGGGTPVLISPEVYEIDTLRSAIEQADDELIFAGADVISFDPDIYVGLQATISIISVGDTYLASNSGFGINSEISIEGPEDGSTLTLDANDSMRHIQVNSDGVLTLNNLTITKGFAPDDSSGLGGAILIGENGGLNLHNTTFSANVAYTGGALNFRQTSIASNIYNSQFSDNSTTGDFGAGTGGAIFKRGPSTLFIENSNFTQNTANYSGGAIFTSGDLVINGSTIHNNFSELTGGGISTNNVGVLTLLNSTVSGNISNSRAGGVDVGTDGDVSLIVNSTIVGNQSQADELSFVVSRGDTPPFTSSGGGLYGSVAENIEIHNTLVTGNFETQNMVADDVAAQLVSISSHNLFSVGESVLGLNDGENENQIGSLLAPIDAKILPLADNGGSTQTHLLEPTSPAVNAGSSNQSSNQGLVYDQRGEGFDRYTAAVDIGAIETDVIFIDGFDD